MALKVTIKRRLIIFHKPQQWEEIQARLVADYGEKIAISFVVRRELGFSVRRHQGLVPNDPTVEPKLEWGSSMHYEDQIHLDFYSDAAQSWFQLRYL
jgi:hypothetical protein